MSFKDWFEFPKEYPEFRRLDAWFHDTVGALRSLETSDSSLQSQITTNANNIATNTTNIATNTSNITTMSAATTITLASGWANFGSSDGFAEVRKTRDGLVVIQGRISNTSGSAKTSGSQIGTITSSYRPTRNQLFTGICGSSASQTCLVRVTSAGSIDILHVGGSGGSLANGDWVSLAGMTWHEDG